MNSQRQELFGFDEIGLEKNFFELGGDSLLATRLVAVVENRLGVRLPLEILFRAGTISEMARYIEQPQMPVLAD